MTHMLAQAEAAFLVNPIKALLFAALIVGWAKLATEADSDAGYFRLYQMRWGSAHLLGALVGFGLMLLIPIFWVGLIVGPAVAASSLVGYAVYRNPRVPAQERWRVSLRMLTRRYEQYQYEQAQRKASCRLMSMDEEYLQVPTGDEPFVTAHEKLEALLDFALPRGADRVDVQANKQQVAVSARIDGVRYDRSEFEPEHALEMIEYLKEAAGLDVEDKRKRQTGELFVEHEREGKSKPERHTLELTTAGSTRGLQMSIDIDRTALANIPFEKLGLLDAQRKQLEQVLADQGGVVLTAAPPRQGLTTLTYALMQRHDPYTSQVITLEEEVAFEAEGVSHNELESGYTNDQFAKRLTTLLRRDPNVVMLSHVADAQAADLVCKNAEEIRFYVPQVEPDTFAALRKWLETVGSKRKGGEALVAVVASRLLRKLCTTCRQPYKPDPSALKRLNLSSDRVSRLYHASGEVEIKDKDRWETCPKCLGLGYRGRVGVYEVMPLDAQARAFVSSGEFDRLRSHLRKQKVLWLQEAALNKVVEGVTDIKEVTRVMGQKSGKSDQNRGSQSSREGEAEQPAVKEQSGG